MKQKNPFDVIPQEILARCVFKAPKDDESNAIPILVEVKSLARDCDDCGQDGSNRVVHMKHYKKPYSHWRRYCTRCARWKNPLTGAWDMTNNSIDAYYRNNKKPPK